MSEEIGSIHRLIGSRKVPVGRFWGQYRQPFVDTKPPWTLPASISVFSKYVAMLATLIGSPHPLVLGKSNHICNLVVGAWIHGTMSTFQWLAMCKLLLKWDGREQVADSYACHGAFHYFGTMKQELGHAASRFNVSKPAIHHHKQVFARHRSTGMPERVFWRVFGLHCAPLSLGRRLRVFRTQRSLFVLTLSGLRIPGSLAPPQSPTRQKHAYAIVLRETQRQCRADGHRIHAVTTSLIQRKKDDITNALDRIRKETKEKVVMP